MLGSDAQSVLKKVMNLMMTDGMESERTVCWWAGDDSARQNKTHFCGSRCGTICHPGIICPPGWHIVQQCLHFFDTHERVTNRAVKHCTYFCKAKEQVRKDKSRCVKVNIKLYSERMKFSQHIKASSKWSRFYAMNQSAEFQTTHACVPKYTHHRKLLQEKQTQNRFSV